jgi:hypothetical protein
MGDDAKDAAEYLRKLAHERSADLTFPDATQESEWRIADLIERQAAEIERLRAGGCARDQGTTQFCAEAASAFSVVNMLRAEIAELSAGGWREIDDEARNGEWRMLCGKYGEIFRGRWAPSYNGWMDAGGNSVRKPTHYAPLPTAPEAEA